MAFEREKWEQQRLHDRDTEDRNREQAAYDDLLEVMDTITAYANELETHGIDAPESHDTRMTAILQAADKAVRQVFIYGNPRVHWIGKLTVNTFSQWVWLWQQDDEDAAEQREFLLHRQGSTQKAIREARIDPKTPREYAAQYVELEAEMRARRRERRRRERRKVRLESTSRHD